MLGGPNVPYGELWRTGANEITRLFTMVPIVLAGLAVPPGQYSLYTRPGETEWEIMVNRSLTWSNLDARRRTYDLGSVVVKREWTPHHVEKLTIRPEPLTGNARAIVLEWENTRVRIPVGLGSPTPDEAATHCVTTPTHTGKRHANGLCFSTPGDGP